MSAGSTEGGSWHWTATVGLVDHAVVPPDAAEPKRPRWRAEPSTARLPVDQPHRDEILRRHRQACNEGETVYLDPASGYQVLTADALAGRGACCGSGCRHCPWVGPTG